MAKEESKGLSKADVEKILSIITANTPKGAKGASDTYRGANGAAFSLMEVVKEKCGLDVVQGKSDGIQRFAVSVRTDKGRVHVSRWYVLDADKPNYGFDKSYRLVPGTYLMVTSGGTSKSAASEAEW
jgi:hypothetical protein